MTNVELCIDGKVLDEPKVVSNFGSNIVFATRIETVRLSGTVDVFNMHYTGSLGVLLSAGMYIRVSGDIRTVNRTDSDFVIEGYICASDIEILESEPERYENDIKLKNAELHKFLNFRKSYDESGRSVADYQIKVTRKHSRVSYFKVTSWNNEAVLIGTCHKDCKSINMKARLQSYFSKKSNRSYLTLVTYGLEILEK